MQLDIAKGLEILQGSWPSKVGLEVCECIISLGLADSKQTQTLNKFVLFEVLSLFRVA